MQLVSYQSYDDFHKAFGEELNSAAGSFVKIGYLCKVARDTDILSTSGYANINEYAKAEFGIDKSQVSRFVRINDRFSIDGYSLELKEQFSQIGSSKLTLMLSLPDAVNDIITPDMTKEDIKVLKEEVEAEQKVTDMEVFAESMNCPKTDLTLFEKVAMQIMHDNADIFRAAGTGNTSELQRVTMPEDNHTYSVRIAGIGRVLVHFTPSKIGIVNVRTGEREDAEWFNYYRTVFDKAAGAWEEYFGEPYTEPVEIAPVQPDKPKTKVQPAPVKKEEPKKETPKKEEPKKEEPKKEEPKKEELPEDSEGDAGEESAELVEGTVEDNGGQLKKDLTSAINRFTSCVLADKYTEAKNYLAVMQTLLDSILGEEA